MVFSGGFFFILWSLKEVVASVRSSLYPGLDIYHWMHWGNAYVCRQVASQNVYDMLCLPTEASYRLFLTTFRPSWAGFRCKCFALRIVSPTLWGAFFMLLCFNAWLQCRKLVSQEMITWVVVDWPTAERTCSLFIHLASPTRPHCAPSCLQPQWVERNPFSCTGGAEHCTVGWSHTGASHAEITSLVVCLDVFNKNRWLIVSSDKPMESRI